MRLVAIMAQGVPFLRGQKLGEHDAFAHKAKPRVAFSCASLRPPNA
jgi:hypothetical protein